MKVTLRKATAKDIVRCDLYEQPYRKEAELWDLTVGQWLEFIKAKKTGPFLVITDGKPCGFIRLIPRYQEGREAEERTGIYIFIDKKFQRKGIGTRALRLVMEYAKRENLPTLCSIVDSGNTASRKLFVKAGFSLKREMWVKKP